MTLTVPLGSVGVTACSCVGLTSCTEAANELPNCTPAPARKLFPESMTVVPPSVEPLFGETLEIVGRVLAPTFSVSPAVEDLDFESSTRAVNG